MVNIALRRLRKCDHKIKTQLLFVTFNVKIFELSQLDMMHIYDALAIDLGLKEEPKTLGETLNALQRFLPESVSEAVKQSFKNEKKERNYYWLNQDEIDFINAKYRHWWDNLPSPKYNTYFTELRHWMNMLGIWGW